MTMQLRAVTATFVVLRRCTKQKTNVVTGVTQSHRFTPFYIMSAVRKTTIRIGNSMTTAVGLSPGARSLIDWAESVAVVIAFTIAGCCSLQTRRPTMGDTRLRRLSSWPAKLQCQYSVTSAGIFT